MFASLSHVLGADMVPHLEVIVNKMLESLRSSEGVKVKLFNSLYIVHLFDVLI